MSVEGALSLIPSKIQAMLKDYAEDLEQAWANAGEDPLTISFGAKIGIAKGKNICEVSISFTKEKVKDSVTFEWNANQGELFDHIEKMDADLKRDGMSMEISSPRHESVTLGEDLPDADKENTFYGGAKRGRKKKEAAETERGN